MGKKKSVLLLLEGQYTKVVHGCRRKHTFVHVCIYVCNVEGIATNSKSLDVIMSFSLFDFCGKFIFLENSMAKGVLYEKTKNNPEKSGGYKFS